MSTVPCRVSAELRAYEASQVDDTDLREQAQDLSWSDFVEGNLDDRLDELAADEAYDAVRIAVYHCFQQHRHEPRCSIRDYTATVQSVIDARAEEIYQELIA